MSGLGELGEFYGANAGANIVTVQNKDIDEYDIINIDNPSVDKAFFGTVNGGTAGTNTAFTLLNQLGDWPRNLYYNFNGVSGGTFTGTFIANVIDQFGNPVQEKVVASATTSGGIYGTVIAAKFLSGTFQSQGSSGGSAGTAQIGYGTTSNGSAQSNWFGLYNRILGTSDVKNIRWVNNGTVTGLNKGTAIGTLIGFDTNGSLPSNAFQGTSGVAITDTYTVIFKSSYDNTFKGQMANL